MKLTLLFFISFFSFTTLAHIVIKEEVYIPGQDPQIIAELVQTGSVIIDHVTSEGFEIYGGEGLSEYLDSKNIVHFNIRQMNESFLNDFPKSSVIAQKMKEMAKKYAHIMTLRSIGQSVKGNDLWVMKISKNPHLDEVKPEFKYISSMHGDEITGRELTLMFIEEIGEKYGKDAEITSLVDNTEIFVMPSMNPDGSDMKRRANARGIDLNRNFPDITRDTVSSWSGREIENQHVMKFQEERNFSLSANLHGGTVVANYPWDSKYDRHPFDALIRELSLGYAQRNPEMRNSREFKDGVTNGADWYVVKGGMQDWSYFWHDDLQITLEVSHRKWPSYSDMPQFYQNNRDSMFYFLKEIHRGGGVKFSRPGVSGTILIEELETSESLGSYAFKNSEFYKVLPEGNYRFKILEKSKKEVRSVVVRVEKNKIKTNGNFVLVN